MEPQLEGRKLYHVRNVFYLITEQTETEIEEPIGWDKVLIQVKFDQSTFGYRFEFSDKDALLEFDLAAGGLTLKQLWKERGSQAFASLRFGEINNGVFTMIFEAELNFESYDETEKTVKMNVERKSFNDLLRTRFDFRVDINKPYSLDGLQLDPMPTRDLYLHPRLLSHVASFKYNTNVPVAQNLTDEFGFGIGNNEQWKTAVPPFKLIAQNIDGIAEPIPPDGNFFYSGFELPAGVSKRSIYVKCLVSFKFFMGDQSGFIKGGVSIYKRSNITGGNNGDRPPTVQTDGINLVSFDEYGNVGGPTFGNKTFASQLEGVIDLEADAGLFIKCWIYTPNNSQFPISDFEFTNVTSFSLEVREQTVFAPSMVTTPRIHELVNRQLEIILNSSNPLKSSLLGRVDLGYAADGCAAFHHGMNGLLLRAFDGKPFNLSAKDWVNFLSGLFCMGLSIERDENENEFVRFEELSYFFRDVLLMELPIISKYHKEANAEMTFNELAVTFKKYPQDNQQDSIEEWMTRMNWATPLTKIKNKFEKTIDAILSGYYIEYTRQEAFRENPSNAYETDNDVFLISARAADIVTVGATVTFVQATKKIIVNKLIPVIAGDFIKIENATGGVTNGTYEVELVEVPFQFNATELTVVEVLATDGLGTGDVTICDINGVAVERDQAKRNEDFQQTVNVPFPLSVYNLEHHLKRILLRWAKFFQAGWDFYYDNNVGFVFTPAVTFIEGANNINIRTQLKASVACAYGDPTKDLIWDIGAVPVNSDYFNAPIFGKSKIDFKAPMSWEVFNDLRKAFEGRHPLGLDYGYFRWTNPDGEVEEGFCFGMKFDPNEQMCTFTMVEKYSP